jgi:phosphatidylglycerophosphate synthase
LSGKGLNKSFLARPERILLQRLVRLVPRSLKPSDLTLVGVLGGIMAGVSLVLCNLSPLFLPLAIAGILVNWFGDSVDSVLARVRSVSTRRHGFLFEHSCDLIAQSAMVIGLGFSPYLTLTSALMLLSLYLLMSSYTYLRITVEGVHRLSYAGLGSTEFRVMLAAWPVLVQLTGWRLAGSHYFGLAAVDFVIAGLSICVFVAFIVVMRQDLERIDADEKRFEQVYSCDIAEHLAEGAVAGDDKVNETPP